MGSTSEIELVALNCDEHVIPTMQDVVQVDVLPIERVNITVGDVVDAITDDTARGLEMLGDGADKVIHVTKWGAQWLGKAWNIWRDGGMPGVYAKRILETLDAVTEDPCEFVEDHVKEDIKTVLTPVKDDKGRFVEHVVSREVRKKVTKKLRKGGRSKFAAAVAKMAYNKFGERSYTQANVLVTRSWIQKYLEGDSFKDLRTVDKNIAIDRALFLSFVPTREFQRTRLAMASRAWQDRMEASSSYPGFWTRVFGAGPIDPDCDEYC